MFNKREKHFREALKDTFDTPAGRRVLAHLKLDYVDQTAFNADPVTMGYLNGRRDVVQMMLNLVKEVDQEEQQIVKITLEENDYE